MGNKLLKNKQSQQKKTIKWPNIGLTHVRQQNFTELSSLTLGSSQQLRDPENASNTPQIQSHCEDFDNLDLSYS